MNTTISFKPDGTALCLWAEAVLLHELGRLEITRATNIEFNNTTQQWEVKDLKRKVRSRAIDAAERNQNLPKPS
jgi:hypothetical protein